MQKCIGYMGCQREREREMGSGVLEWVKCLFLKWFGHVERSIMIGW